MRTQVNLPRRLKPRLVRGSHIVLGAVLLLAVATPPQAEPATPLTVPLTVTSGETFLEYRLDNDGVDSWHPCPVDGKNQPAASGVNRLQLPSGEKVQVRGSSRSRYGTLSSLFFLDQGVVFFRVSDWAHPVLTLSERSVFAPNPLGWTMIMASLLVLPFAYLLYRRKIQAMQIAVTQREADKLDAQQLIRADGSLPKRIGDYRPLSILGTGAMGVVYKAEASDKTQCAIKVPLPNLVANEEHRKRFMREIKISLELKHPNLVQILALPMGDYPYLVMEWVQGSTLDSIDCLPLVEELRRCRAWLEQILDTLSYIHQRQIWHRDLKPSNIMIVAHTRVKIMDFGIAHEVQGTSLTATDAALGTPLYMAPEQVKGGGVDARTDLFALGLVIYERLAGGLPYSKDLVMLMKEKLVKPLPRLDAVNPRIPVGVADFVSRLTALKPTDRYPQARAALDDLSILWPEK